MCRAISGALIQEGGNVEIEAAAVVRRAALAICGGRDVATEGRILQPAPRVSRLAIVNRRATECTLPRPLSNDLFGGRQAIFIRFY